MSNSVRVETPLEQLPSVCNGFYFLSLCFPQNLHAFSVCIYLNERLKWDISFFLFLYIFVGVAVMSSAASHTLSSGWLEHYWREVGVASALSYKLAIK